MKWQRVQYQPNLPLGADGQRVTDSGAHRRLSKDAAKEGMVLLKNEGGLLPFAKGTRLAVFGKGCVDYVKGGGGSGDVTVAYTISLYEGLQRLPDYVSVFGELGDFYQEEVRKQYKDGAVPGMTVELELPEELCRKARAFTDTAVVSVCRFSGEGWDRKSSYDAGKKEKNTDPLLATAEKIFEDGDFYLSRAEQAMLALVKKYFSKIVVVLNVGGMVDTEWFAGDEKIGAVLMTWQGGMEGGLAAAELLCGIGNPSGKLSDTFAKRLEDYPSSQGFHESQQYVDYTEDIYVGYRYFETIPGAAERVNYPFGYGLSYTTFDWSVEQVTLPAAERIYGKEAAGGSNAAGQSGTVRLVVSVTNTGAVSGKEVIQVYGSAPQGVLGKPAKCLVAFSKTRLLAPGETQKLFLSFETAQLASYDDLGKVHKSAWLLEAGEYHFYVGTSIRDARLLNENWILNETIIVEQLSEKLAPSFLKKRMLADGSYEELPLREGHDPDAGNIDATPKEEYDGKMPAVRAMDGLNVWKQPYKAGIRPFDQVAEGKMSLADFMAQMTDEELAHLLGGQPNTGVANTFGFGNMPEYGIPGVMTADGPAGLRIEKKCGVNTTAWPCATLLACTWDEELVFAVGEAGAKEVKENNIGVWLTPAINIHRSPLCGRNFEYYSEDPFLTGKLAGAMVRGIQSQHIAATVKHFAFNNKETNRRNSDSRVSERAAREIYLKAFEMIVKEAKPWCLMSSYNIVNGYRTSENRELLEDILRGEWGFDGVVTSDWWTLGEHYKEAKAGNDIKMACGFPSNLMEAKRQGLLSREDFVRNAGRVLSLLLKID